MKTLDLGTHQLKAIEEMHNGSVLRGGVGTGKSRTALAYYFNKECGGEIGSNGRKNFKPMVDPKDIYIITTGRKRDSHDWEDEAARFGIGRDRDVSSGHAVITVDSWNNIGKYAEVKDAFFVFDEQRLVGSGAWVKAFIKIAKANRWILLSATPGDTWMDFVPIFIANGFYKNRTEFIRRHVVYRPYTKFPQIDRYTEINHLVRLRNRIVVEMPFERHTRRHTANYMVEYDKIRWDRLTKDRWHIYEDRPIRDVAELFQVMRKLVNSDPSRLAAAMKLMEKHPRLIVFYTFNYELDMLRILAKNAGITVAEWNGQKHEEVPTTERWLYFAQYTSASEAWNCITTDAMAFWSLSYSYKVMEQSKGRIDRLNTPYIDLFYYLFRSSSPIDSAISKALVTKRNFNEKEMIAQWESNANIAA